MIQRNLFQTLFTCKKMPRSHHHQHTASPAPPGIPGPVSNPGALGPELGQRGAGQRSPPAPRGLHSRVACSGCRAGCLQASGRVLAASRRRRKARNSSRSAAQRASGPGARGSRGAAPARGQHKGHSTQDAGLRCPAGAWHGVKGRSPCSGSTSGGSRGKAEPQDTGSSNSTSPGNSESHS